MLTESDINRLHKEAWADAIEEYGDAFKVPADVSHRISETTRARWAILSHSDKSPYQAMKEKNIQANIISELAENDDISIEQKVRNIDKLKAAEAWIRENVGAQIAPQALVDASGWSYTKVMSYINDNPGTFSKVKRGLYEVRDPKVEREREKVA